jgi:hypothetical protein
VFGVSKQQKEFEKAKYRIILALRQKIAMKHGRKYTGRERGRPNSKLVGADGALLVARRPAGSEEEEEEEGEQREYCWTGRKSSSGLSDRPREPLGVFASLERF